MSIVLPTLKFAWKTKQLILDQNPPVLNTLHTVIDETGGVRLVFLDVVQTNTPTNAEEIDVVVTLDGTAYTYDSCVIGTLANNTQYCLMVYLDDPVARAVFTLDLVDRAAAGYSPMPLTAYPGVDSSKPLEGHTIKVEIRQTSAIAAGARVRVKATYEILRGV